MKHIVFLKLKERTPENQAKLVEILEKLNTKDLPMADAFACGADLLGSERSYDAALVVDMPRENLAAYANDPYHVAVKEEFLPLISGSLTVDFEE